MYTISLPYVYSAQWGRSHPEHLLRVLFKYSYGVGREKTRPPNRVSAVEGSLEQVRPVEWLRSPRYSTQSRLISVRQGITFSVVNGDPSCSSNRRESNKADES